MGDFANILKRLFMSRRLNYISISPFHELFFLLTLNTIVVYYLPRKKQTIFELQKKGGATLRGEGSVRV